MNNTNEHTSEGGLGDAVIEFRSSYKPGRYVVLAFVTSAVSILLAAVTFALLLLSNSPSSIMPAVAGVMTFLGLMGIWAAIYLLRTPVRILVEPEGLTFEWLICHRSFSWNDISQLQLKESDFGHVWLRSFTGRKNLPKEHLLLLGRGGRKVAEVPGDMENFPLLVREIHIRSSRAQGVSTYSAYAHASRQLHTQKGKRLAMLIAGLFFTALGVAFAITSMVMERNKRLLERQGQVVQAVVTKHYIYNITPRLEYSFTADDDRSYSNNVMVTRTYWESLEKDANVGVKYLPSNPKNNKLVSGQVESGDIPFPLAIVCSLFATAMGLVATSMYFFGISDIKFEAGRFIIVRAGQVEPSPAAATLGTDIEDIEDTGDVILPGVESEDEALPAGIPEVRPARGGLSTLPVGLKAIGILNIVLGGLGLLWNAGRIVLAYILFASGLLEDELLQTRTALHWAVGGHVLAGLIALVVIISGVAILYFRNWGRILAIIAASAKLLFGLIEIVGVLLLPPQRAGPEHRFVANVTRSLIVFCYVLTMVYPALVIVLLKRKSTREIFKSRRRGDQDTVSILRE